MKAYRGKDDAIFLFRPLENIRRMNVSAERLCMPQIDENLFMEALSKLVLLDRDWIPRGSRTSLYIRPTMIATEPALGVHPANEYLFFIIEGPVGAYYPEGFGPTKIFITRRNTPVRFPVERVTARPAATMRRAYMQLRFAKKMGYTQVLWLDAVERKFVEEVGTSNMFFMIGDELITAPLTGSILPGVTRDSVIQLARSWGVKVSERRLSMDEVMEAVATERLGRPSPREPPPSSRQVGEICYRGREYRIGDGKTGYLTERLYNEILQIQYGQKDDPFGWRIKIAD